MLLYIWHYLFTLSKCYYYIVYHYNLFIYLDTAAQKMKFLIKYFFGNCDQIRSFLWILSHLLKKSLKENSNFCAVYDF